MKIKVRCDCGKTLVASDKLAGKKTKCPACDAVIRLPLLNEASEQPASFLVTETGLNLTPDSQEDFAATGEEMPHPFNISTAEQTPDASPKHEPSHVVGRIVGRTGVLHSETGVRRETAIRIFAGIGLITWLFTLGSPLSIWAMIHYLGLTAVVACLTLEITERVPRLKP